MGQNLLSFKFSIENKVKEGCCQAASEPHCNVAGDGAEMHALPPHPASALSSLPPLSRRSPVTCWGTHAFFFHLEPVGVVDTLLALFYPWAAPNPAALELAALPSPSST